MNVLNKTEEYVYIERYQATGCKIALKELINGHMPYIMKVCGKIYKQFRQAVDMQDMIQTAIVGYIIGIKKFDLESGHRLLTYATFHIRAELFNTYTNSLPVHIPAHTLREMVWRTDKQRAEELNLMYARIMAILSLNRSVDNTESDDVVLKQFEFKLANDSTFNLFMKYSLPDDVESAMDQLNDLQKDILHLRAGLDMGGQYSLPEIAEELNVPLYEVNRQWKRAKRTMQLSPAIKRLASPVPC